MDKRSLGLLERAFVAEVEAGIHGGLDLMQTKSKLAEKLVADGYLEKQSRVLGGRMAMTVEGYTLTHLGRITYCATCSDEDDEQ